MRRGRELFSDVKSMSFDFCKDICRICIRLGSTHDILYDSLFVDDERGADDAHRRFAIKRFFLPDAKVLNSLKLWIGKQYERQVVFFGEFHMGFDAVFADADDRYVAFLKFVVVFRETNGLS